MLLRQRWIPIKIYLTNISHFLELLFLEFGQREVILSKYTKNKQTLTRYGGVRKKSQTQWKVPDHKIWDTLRYLRFNDLAPLPVFDPICIPTLLFIHSSSCHTLRELTKLYTTLPPIAYWCYTHKPQ